GARAPFVHAALLYRDRDELVADASRFVREALATEGNALAVLGPATASLLEESLGPDAGQVRFGDARAWYARRPPGLRAPFRRRRRRPPPPPAARCAWSPRIRSRSAGRGSTYAASR